MFLHLLRFEFSFSRKRKTFDFTSAKIIVRQQPDTKSQRSIWNSQGHPENRTIQNNFFSLEVSMLLTWNFEFWIENLDSDELRIYSQQWWKTSLQNDWYKSLDRNDSSTIHYNSTLLANGFNPAYPIFKPDLIRATFHLYVATTVHDGNNTKSASVHPDNRTSFNPAKHSTRSPHLKHAPQIG